MNQLNEKRFQEVFLEKYCCLEYYLEFSIEMKYKGYKEKLQLMLLFVDSEFQNLGQIMLS